MTEQQTDQQEKQEQQANGQQGSQNQENQEESQDQQQGDQQGEKQEVGWPEWVSFGLGLITILLVIGLLVYFHVTGEDGPPSILVEANFDQMQQSTGAYQLPIRTTNTGGETAEDVRVQLTLASPEESTETVTFVISFLSSKETQTALVQFQNNPAEGTLHHVISYSSP